MCLFALMYVYLYMCACVYVCMYVCMCLSMYVRVDVYTSTCMHMCIMSMCCMKVKRVRFAGEAMCDDLSGFTHGGLQSGREVAADYLHQAGLGPNPNNKDDLSLCWW